MFIPFGPSYRERRKRIRRRNSSRVGGSSGVLLTTTRRSIDPGRESRLRRKISRISRFILLRATAPPIRLGTAIPSRGKPSSVGCTTRRKTSSVSRTPLFLSRSKSLLLLMRSLLVKVCFSTDALRAGPPRVHDNRRTAVGLPHAAVRVLRRRSESRAARSPFRRKGRFDKPRAPLSKEHPPDD